MSEADDLLELMERLGAMRAGVGPDDQLTLRREDVTALTDEIKRLRHHLDAIKGATLETVPLGESALRTRLERIYAVAADALNGKGEVPWPPG